MNCDMGSTKIICNIILFPIKVEISIAEAATSTY